MIQMILLLLLWIYNEPFNIFIYSLAPVWKISSSNQNKIREANFQLTVLRKGLWRAWKFGPQTQGSLKRWRNLLWVLCVLLELDFIPYGFVSMWELLWFNTVFFHHLCTDLSKTLVWCILLPQSWGNEGTCMQGELASWSRLLPRWMIVQHVSHDCRSDPISRCAMLLFMCCKKPLWKRWESWGHSSWLTRGHFCSQVFSSQCQDLGRWLLPLLCWGTVRWAPESSLRRPGSWWL